ncbi:MAG TPA: CHAD domain-containing protein [Streptosporangiaceae bacterium]
MQNAQREYLLDASRGPDCEQALALAQPGSKLSLANGGRKHTLRRTWLDTFDWRLYRSGLTLEQVCGSTGPAQLMLTGRDGEVLAVQQVPAGERVSWPALLGKLPDGPLRARLEPVAGVRALLPVARATSRLSDMRLLNADAKTVAKVSVDRMSVTFPQSATAAPRLSVRPLRGYQPQADRLAEALAAVPGVRASSAPALDMALAAAGRRPGDYTGRIDVALGPAAPAATSVALVCGALLDTLLANVSGTVRDLDTEFLHDLRVAVRRTRSALKLAAPVLPRAMSDQFRREFKWLGDLTTPARDLDVYLLGFPAMAAGLEAGTSQDLEPFRAHLERGREAARRDLVRGLRSARFSRLTAGWREALAELGGAGRRRPSTARLAGIRIERARQRVVTDGGAITASSPAASLHELRKRCKELRYALEIFGSLHDPAQHWQAVRELKSLQDCLGEFQDTEVQCGEIRAYAEQMMRQRSAPAATLLAMGEIAAGLTRRQRQARADFAGRFADFARPASQGRIQALTPAPVAAR